MRALPIIVVALVASCASADIDGDSFDRGGKADDPHVVNLEVTVTGYPAQAGAEIRYGFIYALAPGRARSAYIQPHPGLVLNDDGSVMFQVPTGNTIERKLMVYLEVDGIPGCSANDAFASSIISVGAATLPITLSPDQPWLAEDFDQEVRDCNQLFAPRHDLSVTASGFTGNVVMEIYVMPDPGYSQYGVDFAFLIDGAGTMPMPSVLGSGDREKILLFINLDGTVGCSEADALAVFVTDPVTGPLALSIDPTNLPRTSDPARDLHDCNKLKFGGKPLGDYSVTVRGSGFVDHNGKPAIFGLPYRGILIETTIANDGFELIFPGSVWEGASALFTVLIDGNGDRKCGNALDLSTTFDAGYATADQVIYLKPEDLPPPMAYCW
ncbi:MAG: hypothetical protein AB7P03_23335 [Kofleriaceae bacterium]